MLLSPRSAIRSGVLSVLVLAMGVAPLSAQEVLTGRVLSPDGPLAGAEVRAEGEGGALETFTREDGRFLLAGLAPGAWTVTARALGYATARRTVEIAPGAAASVELLLESRALPLDPLVVTGTLRETRVADSPVKVDVVSSRLLQRSASRNLMESIGRVNGLYQQVDCAVCYTNNIRINGMEGPYTAVLIDGMPIMGALASVYGLNGIDPAMIERLEILKGPQSTLYGTEAMGGVVNVITKDPRFSPRLSVDASRSSFGESAVNAGVSGVGEGMDGLVSGTFVHDDRFVDENGDGFSDVTLDTRVALFGKGQLLREGRTWVEGSAKLYWEDRFGGVDGWSEEDRGSDRVYGESIRTARFESMARMRVSEGLRLQASYAWHDQDAVYGDQPFRATQHVGFGQLLWDAFQGGGHDVLVGAGLRLESYDDGTPATPTAVGRAVPGLFVQDEWDVAPAWTLLGGLRADRYGEHGAVFSPRMSVRWQPFAETVVRLNAGTGFRAVHVFTEDHAALTGSRDVVLAEELRPERSRSLALNLNQVVEFGLNPMMIDVDAFLTRFGNKIQPDYDTHPDRIVYRNLPGHAESRGVAFSLNQNFTHLPLWYTVGVTLQDVSLVDEGSREPEFFSPEWTGTWTVSWTFPGPVRLDWSGRAVGPMRLPAYPEPHTRPTRSEAWATHDLQLTWSPEGGPQLYLGAKNLMDFTQGSPLVDPGRPFGEAFDTNYVWGPVAGRELVLGLRWARGR